MWKDVIGYEGIYKVSDDGEVKRISYNDCKRKKKLKHERLLAQRTDKDGYKKVSLYDSERVYIKNKFVHRLVAEAFLEMINGKNQVNHKNGIKSDNRVDNLEWVNQSENRIHCLKYLSPQLRNNKLSRPVIQFDMDGKQIGEFPSAKEAERQTGVWQSGISKVCNKTRISAGGFHWEYKSVNR